MEVAIVVGLLSEACTLVLGVMAITSITDIIREAGAGVAPALAVALTATRVWAGAFEICGVSDGLIVGSLFFALLFWRIDS